MRTARSGGMEAVRKHRAAEGMEAQTSCSISNELSYVTDTTGAEQDDLPCDGVGGIACEHHDKSDRLHDCICTTRISDTLNLPSSESNRNASANAEIHIQAERVRDCATGTRQTLRISAGAPGSEVSFTQASPAGGNQPHGKDPPSHSNMSHVLLRHFATGELMSTWQLIEHETVPETSLTDSTGKTTNKRETSEHEQQAAKFEEHHLERLKAVDTGGKDQNLLNKNKFLSKTSTYAKCGCRQENSQLINEYEDAHIFQNTEEQKYVFKKSFPSHELIGGHGEVLRGQEDNNEVSSEIQVLKMSENNKSVPTIKRTTSFPTLLNKPVTRNNSLENQNCFDSIEVTYQKETSIPEVSQQRKVIKML